MDENNNTGFTEEQRLFLAPWMTVFHDAIFEFEERGLGLTVVVENLLNKPLSEGDFSNVIPLRGKAPTTPSETE